ncbi:complement C5-like isoform X1 [Meriones unguiculatus]|uniref:complement C5-like isoform X1 n=1 Tax=Meriones unguiculatus TaxID=10047 RepID=UPI000B4F1FB3|nr:complement C5-like isoform X1 [Meriones unguiculatus]
MRFWGIFLCLIFLEKSWGQIQMSCWPKPLIPEEQRYTIVTPIVFRVGGYEQVTFEAHGHTDPFDVTISIKSYPDKNANYSSSSVHLSPENKFKNSAILTIQPQQLSEGQNSSSHVYLEVVSKHFSTSKKVSIVYDNGTVFIQTDKPVYTPEQPVKVAVYLLDEALKPVTRETVLTFIDPEGSEVGIVEGSNHTGIASFPDFRIPTNPKPGRWTIKAKYREDVSTAGTTHFEIKEHDKAFKITLVPTSDLEHTMEKQAGGLSFQPAKSLQEMIHEQASKYKHPILKKCCYDGARYNHHETCEERVARVKIGPNCVRAFNECCALASENTFKNIVMSRHDGSGYSISSI